MQEWKINTVYPGINININSSDTFKLHAESDVYEKSKRSCTIMHILYTQKQ